MRKAFLFLFLFICCVTKAQQVNDTIVYRYIIAQPKGLLFSNKCTLEIDDGYDSQNAKEKNKSIVFKSFAAVLMYLTSQGWELVSNYGITEGYSGISDTSTYWILRRPSTKEEVQDIIDRSLKKN